ncbi:hypothetical protein [Nocardia pseudobrasiliensis]|uniref:Uncharacterized protein n=1 Tax=Nocardia pseudobrasiliensis TaxID=45979 RepID=A0A370I822_9NOCA|nr:hypothetical protein [Nocardia pseudobrasiliensis]RDI66838.1 hypothetical protein DFR76_104591 [Nocardia pseudobrasiliensis]
MNATAIVGILTAVIAASAALTGYVVNQMAARRERRSKAYAEALRTIRQYQEVPYRVVRRLDSSAATRTALDRQHGEIISGIGFHLGWLELESPETAAAYRALWERCRTFGRVYRKWAWQQPLVSEDVQMAITLPFRYDIKPELDVCIQAMRADIQFFGWSTRRTARRQSTALATRRAAETPPDFTDLETWTPPP